MPPWKGLFGTSASEEQPQIAPSKKGVDTAFETFIDGALCKIHQEASGRSKEQKAIREACKKVIDELRKEVEDGSGGISPPLSRKDVDMVLEPLRMACKSEVPRVMEPALACLHKLVAHAYLQGETTSAGRIEDGTIVSQVVALVAKCADVTDSNVQLAVLRALLTVTTAEHFIVHGDTLMQAVRTGFNMAIGSDSPDIQRTARNSPPADAQHRGQARHAVPSLCDAIFFGHPQPESERGG
eukprot:jgi/Botrbrau1/16895/Bobra.0265s0001.1